MKKVLFAVLLTFVMFLPNLSAAELYGKIEAIQPSATDVEITPSESGAEMSYLVKKANLVWTLKDPDAGRNVDGYWIGLKITAPDTYDTEKANFSATFFDGTSYNYNYKESLDDENGKVVSAWFRVTPEALKALENSETGVEIIKYEFDWDGKDGIDQTVSVKVVTNEVKLGDVPATHKTVTFESEKGTKTFTVEKDKSLEEYLDNETEKEILNSFLAAPEGKELDRMYTEDGEEEKEFKLSDKIADNVTVKVLYKAKTPANPNTGDNIALYGFMGIISLLGLALVIKFRKAN